MISEVDVLDADQCSQLLKKSLRLKHELRQVAIGYAERRNTLAMSCRTLCRARCEAVIEDERSEIMDIAVHQVANPAGAAVVEELETARDLTDQVVTLLDEIHPQFPRHALHGFVALLVLDPQTHHNGNTGGDRRDNENQVAPGQGCGSYRIAPG